MPAYIQSIAIDFLNLDSNAKAVCMQIFGEKNCIL